MTKFKTILISIGSGIIGFLAFILHRKNNKIKKLESEVEKKTTDLKLQKNATNIERDVKSKVREIENYDKETIDTHFNDLFDK